MAAVTFGHASSTENAATATSRTWAHDCTSDNYLVMSVNHRNNPGSSSATYNGVSMTLLQLQTASFNWQNFYGLASPSSGSNNIVASWTNSVNMSGVGMSFANVDSVGTIVTASVAGSAGTDYSATATLAANDMLAGVTGAPDAPSTLSVVTGTERAEGGTGTDASQNAATNTGTGSVSITWDYSAADPKTYVALPLVGAVSVVVTPDLRTYFY